jgi:hypothetical protein
MANMDGLRTSAQFGGWLSAVFVKTLAGNENSGRWVVLHMENTETAAEQVAAFDEGTLDMVLEKHGVTPGGTKVLEGIALVEDAPEDKGIFVTVLEPDVAAARKFGESQYIFFQIGYNPKTDAAALEVDVPRVASYSDSLTDEDLAVVNASFWQGIVVDPVLRDNWNRYSVPELS